MLEAACYRNGETNVFFFALSGRHWMFHSRIRGLVISFSRTWTPNKIKKRHSKIITKISSGWLFGQVAIFINPTKHIVFHCCEHVKLYRPICLNNLNNNSECRISFDVIIGDDAFRTWNRTHFYKNNPNYYVCRCNYSMIWRTWNMCFWKWPINISFICSIFGINNCRSFTFIILFVLHFREVFVYFPF